jgi:predicted DNA-binding WGR domain protein
VEQDEEGRSEEMNNSPWRVKEYSMEYNDAETNSHKFYTVYVLANDELNDYRVLYHWGRLGTNGSTNFKMFGSEHEASNADGP